MYGSASLITAFYSMLHRRIDERWGEQSPRRFVFLCVVCAMCIVNK